MLPLLKNLYETSNRALAVWWPAGILTFFREFRLGCKCCAGVMEAQITNEIYAEGALYFSEAQFHQLWPGVTAKGSSYGYDPTGKVLRTKLFASREMVEEAAGRLEPL